MPDAKTSQPRPQMVSLAAVVWDFPLVGRTRMLAEAWQRVAHPHVFVEIPSIRSAVKRLAFWHNNDQAPIARAWPTFPSRYWNRISEKTLVRSIKQRAKGLKRELDKMIDWDAAVAMVVSPVWTPWLSELPFKAVVYDCIDDLTVQTPNPELADLYRRWENKLIVRSSGAVVSAQVLADGIRERAPQLPIEMIRNGVDVERFQHIAKTTPCPADIPNNQRPIIGFVGALYEWIDWPLIVDVIRQLPEFDFVFVGPHDGRSNVGCIEGLANAYLLGPKPFEMVPAYMHAFDVCWVPFAQDKISKAANPVKMYEYLALGKPVVSTPVADTESFEGHVLVGDTADNISSHLRAAFDARDSGIESRIDFAQRNSWDARGAAYVQFARSIIS